MSGTFAQGINRRISIARQTGLKTLAATSGGQILRRITSEQNLAVDSFQSQEILQSQQLREMRLGSGRGTVAYQSQLAPGAQQLFIEGALRRPFAAVTAVTASTISATAGPPGTFTRSSGSWITDGFRVGMVVRCTGFTTTATANNNRNYRITAITATVITTSGTNDEVVVTKAAGDSVTISVVGKVTYIPATNQSKDYFTFEDLLPDLSTPQCDVYQDCRVQSISLNVPATGIAQISVQMMSRDVVTQTTAYFTSPAAAPTTSSVTGLTGLLRINGADVAIVTQVGLQIGSQVGGEAVVGANRMPDIFLGTISVQGTATVYLQDYSFINLFKKDRKSVV